MIVSLCHRFRFDGLFTLFLCRFQSAISLRLIYALTTSTACSGASMSRHFAMCGDRSTAVRLGPGPCHRASCALTTLIVINSIVIAILFIIFNSRPFGRIVCMQNVRKASRRLYGPAHMLIFSFRCAVVCAADDHSIITLLDAIYNSTKCE